MGDPDPSTFAPVVEAYIDEAGRRFEFVHVTHPMARDLVVHFSAFFGRWGDAKAYRDRFQGYFHRLKMLGSDPSHNWLFLCDAYGAHDNGTYYLGEKGDLFVERAMTAIIEDVLARDPSTQANVFTVGSSMGATAALKFGLRFGATGVVAVGPHVDLDICAALQNRFAEVAFTVADGDPLAPANFPVTRQIRRELEALPVGQRPPRLFVQACADDHGVYEEQVVPLVAAWRQRGGQVDLDGRPQGGHTSDYATRPLLLDVLLRMQRDEPVPLERYQTEAPYLGAITRPPLEHRIRRRLSPLRQRLRRS